METTTLNATQEHSTYDYLGLIKAAERDAINGSGLSDVLYEKNLQASFTRILENSPEEMKPIVEEALKVNGYDPSFEPYVAKDGECRLTGIEIDHCPCGRHP